MQDDSKLFQVTRLQKASTFHEKAVELVNEVFHDVAVNGGYMDLDSLRMALGSVAARNIETALSYYCMEEAQLQEIMNERQDVQD